MPPLRGVQQVSEFFAAWLFVLSILTSSSEWNHLTFLKGSQTYSPWAICSLSSFTIHPAHGYWHMNPYALWHRGVHILPLSPAPALPTSLFPPLLCSLPFHIAPLSSSPFSQAEGLPGDLALGGSRGWGPPIHRGGRRCREEEQPRWPGRWWQSKASCGIASLSCSSCHWGEWTGGRAAPASGPSLPRIPQTNLRGRTLSIEWLGQLLQNTKLL